MSRRAILLSPWRGLDRMGRRQKIPRSSSSRMTDPRRRKELVTFVRATLEAAADLQKDPKRYFPLISEMTKHPQEQIARSWEHHDFPLRVAPDLLDLLTEEEKWVAAEQKRTPRSRAELAGFIDTSILKEAQALNANR